MIKMEIEPIGKVLTDFSEKFGIPRQSGRIEEIEGRIELNVPYCSHDYIKGIEQYSHLWIIWGFSENEQKKKHATVRPPRLGGNARIGVFASRSPFRPNNLALSCVKLKDVIESNGRKYLLETPLRADFAIIYATKADKFGNAFLDGTTRNFNTVMATAADVVILEPEEISDEPLDPAQITIPGIFVDYIVTQEK